jgi:hypothetical protein
MSRVPPAILIRNVNHVAVVWIGIMKSVVAIFEVVLARIREARQWPKGQNECQPAETGLVLWIQSRGDR